MKIKVKYTAQLKKATGKGEELIELAEGSSIADLLSLLYHQNTKAFSGIVFDENEVFLNAVLLILNGRQVNINTMDSLKENDVLTIMSPIAGG